MNIDRKKIRIFLCALWPGGGYMYFGMMKKGTMVMALFTAGGGGGGGAFYGGYGADADDWMEIPCVFAARYLVLLLF